MAGSFLLARVLLDTMVNCGCAIPDEAFVGLEEDAEQDEEQAEDLRRCALRT
jgi:hypothetical protein